MSILYQEPIEPQGANNGQTHMCVGRIETVDMETYVIHAHAQLCTCAASWLVYAWTTVYVRAYG